MIMPYPPRKAADRVLAKLGDDFYHDDVHALALEDEDTAVAGEDNDQNDASSDTSDDVDAGLVDAAVAEDATPADSEQPEAIVADTANPLSGAQADKVQQVHETMLTLESAIDSLKAVGAIRGVQCVEYELKKQRRRERELVSTSPAVADAFLRLRATERQDDLVRSRIAEQQKERKRDAAKMIADRDAAVADLRKMRRLTQEMESARSASHAIKTFTVDALGADSANAGGAKARKNRFEVLDRLARLKAGLSPGQKNDWQWFKNAWDEAMIAEHEQKWAALFSAWVQSVLNDERSNAFSLFVYNETRRVLSGTSALHVPG